MTSKGAKLRAKRSKQRGRPLKADVARTDTGRISRAKDGGAPPDEVARAARIMRLKLVGIDAKHASTPQAATYIGRLSLTGELSNDQYEALVRFSDAREVYMLSINAPDSLRSKGPAGRPTMDEEAEAENKARVKNRYMAARAAVDRAQAENPRSNLWSVVQYAVIDNLDFPYMIGDLRIVGNALNRHYQGLDRVAKSA